MIKNELKKHIINIDKLQLSYLNTDIKIINKNDFNIEYVDVRDKKLHNNNYHYTIKIYYKDTHFITLLHKLKSFSFQSLICLVNNRFYTDDWNTILIDFLKTYKIINYKFSKIEVSINTNDIITRKFFNSFRDEKIIFNDGYNNYDTKDYGNTIEHITKDFSKRTFYIYNKKKDLRVRELRIEDKTNEIEESSFKNYILDFYDTKGLDVSKNIYRMELTINFNKTKRSNIEYKNINTNEIITDYRYKNLTLLEKKNYKGNNIYTDYKKYIDINNLTDYIFLTKLFNTFVMFNYEILIKRLTSDKLIFNDKRKDILTKYDYIKKTSLEFDSLFN